MTVVNILTPCIVHTTWMHNTLKKKKKGAPKIFNKWFQFVNLQIVLGMIMNILNLLGVPSAEAKGRKCSFWGKLRLVKSLLLQGIKSTNCITWNYSWKGEFLSFRDSNSEVYAEERWMISILIN